LLNDDKAGLKPFNRGMFLLKIVAAGITYCKEIKTDEEQIAYYPEMSLHKK